MYSVMGERIFYQLHIYMHIISLGNGIYNYVEETVEMYMGILSSFSRQLTEAISQITLHIIIYTLFLTFFEDEHGFYIYKNLACDISSILYSIHHDIHCRGEVCCITHSTHTVCYFNQSESEGTLSQSGYPFNVIWYKLD